MFSMFPRKKRPRQDIEFERRDITNWTPGEIERQIDRDQDYDNLYGQTYVQDIEDIHSYNHLRRNAPEDIKREANRIIRALERKWPSEGPNIYDPIGSNRYQLSFMINMLAYNFKKRKERRGLDPWNTRDFGRWLNTFITREE